VAAFFGTGAFFAGTDLRAGAGAELALAMGLVAFAAFFAGFFTATTGVSSGFP
jgi:hypothetical protein